MTNAIPLLSIDWSDAEEQALVLQFVLAAEPATDTVQQLENLVDLFVTAGNHAAFVRDQFPPEGVSLTLTARDHSSPLRPVFSLRARGLDVRSVQVLRNISWRFSAQAHPIVSVEIRDRTPNTSPRRFELPAAEWGTEEEAYPPLSNRLGFRVEREDPLDYRKSRRCLVEFGRPVPNDVIDAAIARAREWVSLAELGAFSPPAKPPEEAEVWEDVVAAYDEYSVELVMSLFEASELSWNVLLNLLAHFSRTIEPVTLVTIE